MKKAFGIIAVVFTVFFSCKKHDNVRQDRRQSEKFCVERELSESVLKKKRPIPPTTVANRPILVLVMFDGYTVKNTAWNSQGDIVCTSANLSPASQQTILDTIGYHYKGFNVKVTTNELEYDTVPFGRKRRLIITETYEPFGYTGGTAYIGSMFWSSDEPAFVFSLCLGYNIKKIQEAATHEVGHTIGLRHQSLYDTTGEKLAEYRPGNDSLEWIMSAAYTKKAVWTIGPNSISATTIQNDTLFIHQKTD